MAVGGVDQRNRGSWSRKSPTESVEPPRPAAQLDPSPEAADPRSAGGRHDGLDSGEVRLKLLKGFELRRAGRCVPLPMTAQRLVAFLAIQGRPVHRLFVAGQLWINASESRSTSSLRTTLWRLTRSGTEVVSSDGQLLRLCPNVAVDVNDATRRARCIMRRSQHFADDDPELLKVAGDLLPDWYDDWVLIERERFRQLRLHALEVLCEALAAEGRFADAVDAGLAAVAGEPLRESAHRAVIAAYLAEGNPSEALRHYALFRRLVTEELGLAPSPLMKSLVNSVRSL
jgi:DNA-binding SARP family transcriptional activator